MRKIWLAAVAFTVTLGLSAQDRFKKNTGYFEILGNGLVLSVNYERQVHSQPGLGWYLGIGLGGDKPAIPMGVKYLFGLGGKKHLVETGLGITWAEIDLWDDHYIRYKDTNPYRAGFSGSVGYRYHARSGFMCRLNYTPVYSRYRSLPVFFGTSVGWRF